MILRLPLLLILMLLMPDRCPAESIHIAAENSWPPFSDQRGEGISRRLVDAALQTQGITTRYTVLPYARVLYAVATGEVDAGFNVTRQKTTEAQFLFGTEPLLQASASWYFRPQDSARFDSFTEIPKGLKVGLIIDYEYGDEFERLRAHIVEVRVSNQQQLVKMLLQHRVDAIVMFDRVADYTLQQMYLPLDALTRGFQNHMSDIYVAFNRSGTRSAHLITHLDNGLRAIKASGLYESLLNSP